MSSCNYNNCTDVLSNSYQGATFVTLIDPAIFSATTPPSPIYFYDAYSCPEPLCCNPDAVASVSAVTSTGVSLTAGLSAPVMSGWKACHTLVEPCEQECGPCPEGQLGQVTPLAGDCSNAASSWACCTPEVQCKSVTGVVFRLLGYGCD